MSKNYEELYKKLKEDFDMANKNNDEICKEYESTIEMLTESIESFKKEKASYEQKLLKNDQDIKSLKKEKDSLLNKNKDKITYIQNLNKKNDKLSNELKKLKEEKALFDSKIVSLENDNDHLNKKIREYDVFTQDLENQLESALEENITLQTEFETFKQTSGEQLIRKDEEIRDIKNDLLNKEKFIQRLQTKANNAALLKNLQKDFNENVTKVKRRFTIFQGAKNEESNLDKSKDDYLNNEDFLEGNFERSRSHTIHEKDEKGSSKKGNKIRNSVFMSGLGSLAKLKHKKEELSRSHTFMEGNKKNENKYLYPKKDNKNISKSLFSNKSDKNDKNSYTPRIEEIAETDEKEEKKESNENKIKPSWEIIQENQFEFINLNYSSNKEVGNKTIIIEDLQKMLDRIRKRKEKLVYTKKINKERMKKLKQK